MEAHLEQARALPETLCDLGIDLAAVAQQLEEEGVQKFVASYDKLLAAVERRWHELQSGVQRS